ncbi:MAG: hypothetical protein QOD99_2100 [Chthoniobacter sp.]|jgi:outer membrane protein TolC|nr:hypothetical protein [Chthoniobacter sp.]
MKSKILFLVALLAATTWLGAGDDSLRNYYATRNLTLDEAVLIALQQNPDILRALQNIQRTRGLVIEVRSQALPQISAIGVYNQQDKRLLRDFGGGGVSSGAQTSPTPATSGTTAATGETTTTSSSSGQAVATSFGQQDKSWQVMIQGRQVIYSGALGPAIRLAKFAQDSAYWSLRDTIDTVIATTRRQFYDVLLDRELIKVQQESVELLGSQLKDQQNRFEAGTVPRFNTLQAEVALANAQPALIAARNNYLVAQLTLAKTLGLGASKDHPGAAPINAVGNLDVEARDFDIPAALETAHARRPFLKVQRLQILQEVEDVKVQFAGFQPTISVNGGYEFRNSRSTTALDEVVDGWFFGATGSWNIWDSGGTYGRIKEARAKLETAKTTYEDSQHQVDLEVQQAVLNLRQARETLASQQKTVQQALEAERLARERLSAGAGVQLDVLNAQVQLTQARSTELQARHDYKAAFAEFERVTATATQYEETFNDPLTRRQQRAAERDASIRIKK